jgi:hypothetical protein
MPKKGNIKSFIKKANKRHNNKYDYSKSVYVNSETYLIIICRDDSHGYFEFKKTPYTHLLKNGNGCHKCSKCYVPNNTEIIEIFKNIHGELYDYRNVNYKNNTTKVSIICKIHGEFSQSPKAHKIGQGCPICGIGKIRRNTTKNSAFIERLKEIHGNRYDYSKTQYTGSRNKIIATCKIHGDFNVLAYSILYRHGCKECGKKIQILKSSINLIQFVEKCSELNYNKYDYSLIESIGFSLKNKVNIVCPFHGTFTQIANYHFYGQGCKKCKSSKGEYRISKYLQEEKIEYIFQHKFDDCINKETGRKLRFDFYLPTHNLCIEFDGGQHFKSVMFFGGDKAFYKRQELDEIKNRYCNENNIELFRIPYNIKNLNNYLKTLFK